MIRRIALFCILLLPCVCSALAEEHPDSVHHRVISQCSEEHLALCTFSAFLPKHHSSPRRVDPSGNTGDMEWDGWDNEPGDVNGDGSVDADDLRAMVSYILKKPTGMFDRTAADLNLDGTVSIGDVTLLIRRIYASASRAKASAGILSSSSSRQESSVSITY